jgi:ADP-ribosylglycohydrolase
MVGMSYRPDVETARRLGRPFDILHEHARFYDTSYSSLAIERSEQESEHGNAVPALAERYHYHTGLSAGENTLAAHLARVLMRTTIDRGRYDQNAFLDAFIEYMTTPGANRDPYAEIYLRHWFENYASGRDPVYCADTQRTTWSIGSHGGMIRPLVLALLAPDDGAAGLGLAIEHQNLTHRSENVAAALSVTTAILQDTVAGETFRTAVSAHADRLRKPKVSGKELYAAYRSHDGPGNIPAAEMWRLHTELEPLDLHALVSQQEEDDVINGVFATACYPEHGLPLALYLALKHDGDLHASLTANANAGGDNVHRGAVLGILVGAACDEIPSDLKEGLADSAELQQEIEAFADCAVSGYSL